MASTSGVPACLVLVMAALSAFISHLHYNLACFWILGFSVMKGDFSLQQKVAKLTRNSMYLLVVEQEKEWTPPSCTKSVVAMLNVMAVIWSMCSQGEQVQKPHPMGETDLLLVHSSMCTIHTKQKSWIKA